MDPANVLRLVHALGGHPLRVLVVGCEPGNVEASEEGSVGLSPQVEAAVDEAIMMMQSVLDNLEGSVV